MKTAIVLPARYQSARFAGKPLTPVKGRTTIHRSWLIAKAADVGEVFVTTDDVRIKEHCENFGAYVVMTGDTCRNGTERVFEALNSLDYRPDVVVNFQGDAALTPPWVLQQLVETMREQEDVQLATPAVRLSVGEYRALVARRANGMVGGTLVVFDSQQNALYFSRSIIPFVSNVNGAETPVHRHIGVYAYRFSCLEQYVQLPMGKLEALEGLEQLRALENQIPIKMVLVDYRGRTDLAVDSPADVAAMEAIIEREGELV